MIRAIYEWCVDNGLTPYLLVAVDDATRVPQNFVKNGEIVFNINYSATKDLLIGNDAVTFSARFNGKSCDIFVPIEAARAVFARESGQGIFFDSVPTQQAQPHNERSASNLADAVKSASSSSKKPNLKLVN